MTIRRWKLPTTRTQGYRWGIDRWSQSRSASLLLRRTERQIDAELQVVIRAYPFRAAQGSLCHGMVDFTSQHVLRHDVQFLGATLPANLPTRNFRPLSSVTVLILLQNHPPKWATR